MTDLAGGNPWSGRLSLQARHMHMESRPRVIDAIVAAAKAGEGRILDIGTGNGEALAAILDATRLLGSFRCKAVAGDRDVSLLDIARNRVAAEPVLLDAGRLPFAAGSFRIVITRLLFLWLREPDEAAREIGRVLHQRGIFVSFDEPDYSDMISTDPDGPDITRTALRAGGADPSMGGRMQRMLQDAGFAVEEQIFDTTFPRLTENEIELDWGLRAGDMEIAGLDKDEMALKELMFKSHALRGKWIESYKVHTCICRKR